MDLASKIPPPSAALPSEPPSGVRLRSPDRASERPTLAYTRPDGGRPRAASPAEGVNVATEIAFTEFVKVQVKLTPKYADRLRIPVDVAEDIRQRSLAKLFPLRAEIEPDRWEAWLWNAMRLRALEHFRSARRARKREPGMIPLLESWQCCDSPEVELYQRECARELLALLDKLAPERREVVCLYLIDDLPMKEVAEKLGIPEDTAKNRWRLAAMDMALAWERDRAKERSNALIAALFVASAFLLAFWRRLFRHRVAGIPPRRGGALLACAACALLVSAHDEPSGRADRRELRELVAGAVEGPSTTGSHGGDGAPALRGEGQKSADWDGDQRASSSTAPAAPSGHESPLRSAPATMVRQQRASWAAPSLVAAPPGAVSAEPAAKEGHDTPADASRKAAQRRDLAHKYLANITELHRQGKADGARRLLNLYRLSFPDDPLPREHAKLASMLATP